MQRNYLRDRNKEIKRFFRLYKKTTIYSQLQTDKFAVASEIIFFKNCEISYRPGQNVTFNEQLFPFKAWYKFTQYMPSISDKFG